DFTPGPLQVTSAPTDLMIDGNAFFALRAEDSEEIFYTRSGSFLVDQEGYLISVESSLGRRYHVLDDQQQVMQVSDWDSVVDYQGNFRGTGQRIGVVSFGDVQQEVAAGGQTLIKVGLNRYTINPYSEVAAQWLTPDAMAGVAIFQGGLETSNVNVVREMVTLISATRAYEASQRVIQMTDQTLAMANEVGKV
ncbi:MAG: hypothetical protein FWF06_07800, partial [Symbiobacteriaceae bacterium]|nr:hypothetical protein [Symbiobacteriaceae bacterium]